MEPFDQPTTPYPSLPAVPGADAMPAPAGPFQATPTALPPARLPMSGGPFATPGPSPRPEAINDRFKLLVPAVVAAFGPRVGMRGVAALVTGMMRGRDAKLARQEQIEETQRRRAMEAAEFRKNAVDELLASSTPDELQAKYAGMAEMAAHHGVDLQSALAQAVGVVTDRVDEAATKTQQSKAADVVKHNDQTNPGQWSAPDEGGTMRPRDWWVNRAGAPGLLPGKAPDPRLTRVTTVGPQGEKLEKAVTDDELQAGVPGYVEPKTVPQGPQGSPQWVKGPDGQQAYRVPRTGDTRLDPVAERQTNSGTDPKAEALDTMREVKRIATDLRNSAGFSGAFGVVSARMPTLFQSTADAEVLLNSLRSLLTLENTGKLKGVLSNADMELLRQASTTLAPQMGEPAARAELDRLIGVMDRALAAVGESGAGDVTGPQVGERRIINGQMGEWDGKGWKAVAAPFTVAGQ